MVDHLNEFEEDNSHNTDGAWTILGAYAGLVCCIIIHSHDIDTILIEFLKSIHKAL